ncbi:MAG: hypothetical protein U1E21_00990 [Reyranellaceae bacterium]
MMRQVYLYGALGRRYGWRHRFDIASLPEAVWALEANHPGFRQAFFAGPAYAFVRGATRRHGRYLEERELALQLGPDDLHIVPAAAGRGGDGGKSAGKIILGVAMVAGAFLTAGVGALAEGGLAAGVAMAETATPFSAAATGFLTSGGLGATAFSLPLGLGAITYGNIAGIGAIMALSGISQLISPTPQVSPAYSQERPEARTSFIYSGPVNTAEQGGPIPIVYGRMRVGSTLASSDVGSDEVTALEQTALPDGGTARSAFTGGTY